MRRAQVGISFDMLKAVLAHSPVTAKVVGVWSATYAEFAWVIFEDPGLPEEQAPTRVDVTISSDWSSGKRRTFWDWGIPGMEPVDVTQPGDEKVTTIDIDGPERVG